MATGYFGKYSAIVNDNVDPDKLGQLKVEVPAVFPEGEIVVARPALPYGVFFLPEVGVNIWVEFEGGDTALPLWTGVQYIAGSEWAPESDIPEKRVLRTPSGHIVMFDDKGGEEKIEITDGVNGHVVTLDSNGINVSDGVNGHEIVLSGSGVDVKDGVNKHELAMTSSGVTATEGNNQNKLELSAAGGKVETTFGAKVELTAALTSVDAGPGIVEVKGSLVKLSSSAAVPVLRIGDSGIGNLGAPVPLIGPGNPTVMA
jgi:hypothetical protein